MTMDQFVQHERAKRIDEVRAIETKREMSQSTPHLCVTSEVSYVTDNSYNRLLNDRLQFSLVISINIDNYQYLREYRKSVRASRGQRCPSAIGSRKSDPVIIITLLASRIASQERRSSRTASNTITSFLRRNSKRRFTSPRVWATSTSSCCCCSTARPSTPPRKTCTRRSTSRRKRVKRR